jgi:CRP/FNR family cyclic AMP-dependent transcriptional regulator
MTILTALIEGAGWASTAVCIWAFQSKTMIPLRFAAMLANVLSIIFSYYHASWPNLVLNAVLLPLNIWRLMEMQKLVADVRRATTASLEFDWLKPFMRPAHFRAAERLFAKGDKADAAYVIVRGRVRLPEVGVTLGPGDLFGEMGLFTDGGVRTAAAVCDTEVEALVLTYDRFEQLYFQNPEFGLYLVRLIVQRLDRNRLAAQSPGGATALKPPLPLVGPQEMSQTR